MFADRGTRSIVALAGGGAIVVVLGLLLVGGVVVRGAGGDSTASPPDTSTPRPAGITVTTAEATTTPTTAAVPRAALDSVEVHVDAGPNDAFDVEVPIVDRLPARSVLRVYATGFDPNGTGFVEQCSVARCGNAFPVVFDSNGASRFQYLVSDAFAAGFEPPSTCRRDEPPCVVHVRVNGYSAFLGTLFHDGAPAPKLVTVTPARPLVAGERVRIAVAGFNPGERVQAMLCAAPATYGPERCGAPGPVSSFTIGADAVGRTSLVVRAGRVGSEGASCGRGTTCGIVVAYPQSSVPAPVAAITFGAGPAARYDSVRWLTGIGIAILLLALAVFLIRTTDWRKPSEADTPELDGAELIDEMV